MTTLADLQEMADENGWENTKRVSYETRGAIHRANVYHQGEYEFIDIYESTRLDRLKAHVKEQHPDAVEV